MQEEGPENFKPSGNCPSSRSLDCSMARWLDGLIAWSFYQLAKKQKLPRHLKDQLVRASSSVALNLHEGWGRRTTKDRTRFFSMALGSLREVQSIIKLGQLSHQRSAV